MRIKLKKGYQEKLILSAKERNNLSWNSFSEKLSISENYLRHELRKEKRLLSEKVYKILINLAGEDFEDYIESKLEDDWGRLKGSKTGIKPELLIKEPSIELAEFVGIILGDGNLWERKGGYYYTRICGDSQNDRDYLLYHVKPLFEKLFNTNVYVRQHRTSRELFLTKGDKNIIFTLKYFGLKTGNKLKNNIGIPKWIFDNNEYLKACIRGLIDTDGSVCPITGRNYPYIWFSCNIPNLRKDFETAMAKLGYKLSKWNIREGHAAETYIGNKSQIERFFKEINLSNPKHRKKFHAPMV